jgi:hypothetical protein
MRVDRRGYVLSCFCAAQKHDPSPLVSHYRVPPILIAGRLFLPIFGFLSGAGIASAEVNSWQFDPGMTGSWFSSINWTDGTPTSDDETHVANGGTAWILNLAAVTNDLGVGPGAILQTSGSIHIDDRLSVGALEGSPAEYMIRGGRLRVIQSFHVGHAGRRGNVIQTGGEVTLGRTVELGDEQGGRGIYELQEGQLTAADVFIVGDRGDGELTQSGGTLAAAGSFIIARQGTATGVVSLAGGTLSTDATVVGGGGDGQFTHSGGRHVTETLFVGGAGGATAGAPNRGRYHLGGDGELEAQDAWIGWANAEFIQDGGTATIHNALNLGITSEPGFATTFTINGGSFTAGTENIGLNYGVTLRQNGGDHLVQGALNIGLRPVCPNCITHSGYELTGGTLEVQGNETVGYDRGYGDFVQSGGEHVVEGDLRVGTDGGQAIYRLEGGVLRVGGDLVLSEFETSSQGRLQLVGGLGMIEIDGDLLLRANREQLTSIEATIDATGLTHIQIDGTATLGGDLSVDIAEGVTLEIGQMFPVLTAASGITGSLALTGPDGGRFVLSTTDTAVTLIAIPEPASLALLVTAGILLVALRLGLRIGIHPT